MMCKSISWQITFLLLVTILLLVGFNQSPAPEPVVEYVEKPVVMWLPVIPFDAIPEEEPVVEPDRGVIEVSEAEFDLLCHLVSAEAKGEPMLGKIAVVNAVMNRVNSPAWGNSIKDVVFEPDQFDPVTDGSIYDEPTDESIEAVRRAMNGEKVIDDNVDCFAHKSISFSSWASYYATIDNHSFWVSMWNGEVERGEQ